MFVRASKFAAAKTVSAGSWKRLRIPGRRVLCKERMLETIWTVGNVSLLIICYFLLLIIL